MDKRTKPKTCRILTTAVFAGFGLINGCGEDAEAGVSTVRAPLRAECAPDDLPEDAWTCDEALTVECAPGGADVGVVYVAADASCAPDLNVSDPGPFGAGTHAIAVSDGDGNAVCSTTLTVVDTEAPVVEEHELTLWAPNHKFHAISVDDCVTITDACDGPLQGEFIWGSSDEPVNDLGDGNHEPDILFDDCERVSLRSERKGPKDGRVYRLGVRAEDASGNAVEGSCTVRVHHDQRGTIATDSGEAYRITLDGTDGTPVCDGVVSPPDDEEPPPEGDGDATGDGDGDGDATGDGDTSGDGDASGDGDDPIPVEGPAGPA